jgi:hypothetical protein
MEEGGICLWDLDESASRHPEETLRGGASVCTRRSAYTTDNSPGMSSSGVVAVVAVSKGGMMGMRGKGEEDIRWGGCRGPRVIWVRQDGDMSS